MERKRIIYVIKWVKNEKPFFQLGEFVMTGMDKYLPARPEIFFSLNTTLQAIKNKFSSSSLMLLTMGIDKEDVALIDKFIATNSFITGHKNIAKPLGKKSDGTPYRVFMVDSDFEALKKIKRIIVKEHFEIIGIARDSDHAMDFLRKHHDHIDILITELYLEPTDGYKLIQKVKDLSPRIKIIIVTKSNSELDIRKAVDLKINGYIIKPIDQEKLINDIKKVLS
ncbi:MAG: response regulator transcription factor [Spirochaetes bacterium]|nr:response regulator transcription factor [Spirochaetota bacterium]